MYFFLLIFRIIFISNYLSHVNLKMFQTKLVAIFVTGLLEAFQKKKKIECNVKNVSFTIIYRNPADDLTSLILCISL